MEKDLYLKALLEKFREGSMTRHEYDLLTRYMGKPGTEEKVKQFMETHWEELDETGICQNPGEYQDDEFDKIWEAIKRTPGKTVHQGRVRGIEGTRVKAGPGWYKIAAVIVVLLASAAILYYSNPNMEQAPVIAQQVASGQKATITLPDGTVVKLNSDSKLSFPEEFRGDTREVTLEGEAFFEVQRNEKMPFLVKTGALTTRVLGTSFNIKAYKDEGEIAVSVATGKVEVSRKEAGKKEKDLLVLTPNEQALYKAKEKSLVKQEVNTADIAGWKDGVLFFERPLGEVVKILERWYGVEIQINNPELANCIIRGKHKKETLLNVLKTYHYSLGITYKINPSGDVEIDGKGCKD
ncbi:FecR family protein [Sinomicrobium sp. M5D2P17]